MEFDFLSPLDTKTLDFVNDLSSQHLGAKMLLHTAKDFPDLDKVRIALIGVLDNRGSEKPTEHVDLAYLRRELYHLYPGNEAGTVADLGNILPGDTIADAHYAGKK